MFKLLKKIKSKKIFSLLLLIMVGFSPIAILKEKQSESLLLIKNIGIDYEEGKYITSIQIIIPENSASFKDKYKIVKNEGASVTECFKNITLETGKEPDFSHCNVILVGGGFLENNVADALGYFTVDKNINSKTIVICTEEKASEIFDIASQTDSKDDYDPLKIIKNNRKYLFEIGITIDDFFKGYYSVPKISIMGNLELSDKYGISVENDSSQGQSSGNQSQQEKQQSQNKKSVLNKGDCTILKEGKKVMTLNSDQLVGINFINKNKDEGYLTITVKDEQNKEIQMEVKIRNKRLTQRMYFDGNKPCMKNRIIIDVNVQEFLSKQKDINVINSDKLKSRVIEATELAVKERISKSLNLLKPDNLDIVNCYLNFNRFKPIQWKNFLNKGHKDDYMQHVCFLASVHVDKIIY